MHRWSILRVMIVKRDGTQSSLFIFLQVHSTCFGCQLHPSSGVHKTVTTASGTGHIFVQLPPSNVATLEGGSWPVPEAVVTGLCTPYDGCGWHSNHVEWTCRIINGLLCVVSRWTIINFCNFMFLNTLFPQNLHFVWVVKIRQFSLIINLFRLVIYITVVTIDRNVELLSVRNEDGRKQWRCNLTWSRHSVGRMKTNKKKSKLLQS